ncbi:MAG: hypothetical protein CR968_00395 [Flavobacteriia bacterium]|nr:MAG: hypothetical protein CR968_00395 [Flavobacteriia bacterium]
MLNHMKYLFVVVLFLSFAYLHAQGSDCEDASAFCAGGSTLVFENSIDVPEYGAMDCLSSTPNPSWFYLKIKDPGVLEFVLTQGDNAPDYDNLDVDFICWGPFDEPNCDDLIYYCPDVTENNVIACSYSADPVEYFSINNAQVGEYYMILITNYSNQSGYITLTQTNVGNPGAGETDCTIVSDLDVCYDSSSGDTVDLDATTNLGVVYEWFKDGVLLPETGPILYNITPPDAFYNVLVYDAGGVLINNIEYNVKFWTVPSYNAPPDLSSCDASSDGNYEDGIYDGFDLEAQRLLMLGSQTDFDVYFYENQTDAETGGEANAIDTSSLYENTTPFTQTIYFRVENPGCYDTGEFQLEVYNLPVFDADLQNIEVCDSETYGTDADGIETFDLLEQTAVIFETLNPSLYNVSYHLNQADADTGANALPNTYANTTSPYAQTIYVRIEESSNSLCYLTRSFDIIVEPLPELNADVVLQQCDDNILDGITYFNLTEAYGLLSDNVSQVTFALFTSEADAQNNQNPILTPEHYQNEQPYTDTIWANVNFENCNKVMPFTINVLNSEISTDTVTPLLSCDSSDGDYTNNVAVFNLNDAYQQIEDAFGNNSNLGIVFYENLDDALIEQNPVNQWDNYTNTVTNTLFYRVENSLENACVSLGQFDLQVLPNPETELPDEAFICLGEGTITLEPLTVNTDYSYHWTDASGQSLGNNPMLEIAQGGTYTLTVTNADGCFNADNIIVQESQESLLEASDLTVTQFNNLNTLTIPTGTAYGVGNYEYSLNPDGPFSPATTIYELEGGEYTLYIHDVNGCNPHEVNFSILDYMRFFTPNGDGFNDYWNIIGKAETPNLVIYIFDRYGRLLSIINSQDQGWDGTSNGVPMPASDYWFKIQLEDGSEKTGHFTLKR